VVSSEGVRENELDASDSDAPMPKVGPFLPYQETGSPTPPDFGKPTVLALTNAVHSGVPVLDRDRVLAVVGRDFRRDPAHPVELFLDGAPLPRHGKLEVKKDGSFIVRLRFLAQEVLLLRLGLHEVRARQVLDQKVTLESKSFFLVWPLDMDIE
jgi:hypothetical protein